MARAAPNKCVDAGSSSRGRRRRSACRPRHRRRCRRTAGGRRRRPWPYAPSCSGTTTPSRGRGSRPRPPAEFASPKVNSQPQRFNELTKRKILEQTSATPKVTLYSHRVASDQYLRGDAMEPGGWSLSDDAHKPGRLVWQHGNKNSTPKGRSGSRARAAIEGYLQYVQVKTPARETRHRLQTVSQRVTRTRRVVKGLVRRRTGSQRTSFMIISLEALDGREGSSTRGGWIHRLRAWIH
eukprot:990355-Prorocentrum_minimum.AAC.4